MLYTDQPRRICGSNGTLQILVVVYMTIHICLNSWNCTPKRENLTICNFFKVKGYILKVADPRKNKSKTTSFKNLPTY